MSRSDGGSALPAATRLVRGAEAIARSAIMFARPSAVVRRALVNGAAGVIVSDDGRLVTIIGFNGLRWTDRRD